MHNLSVLNIGLFAQGSFQLIRRDLEEHLPASVVNDVLLEGTNGGRLTLLSQAFTLRRNIVALKKVCKILLTTSESTEDALARGSTLHFRNTVPNEGCGEGEREEGEDRRKSFAHHPTYKLISGNYAACKGARAAVQDLRAVTKTLACIPRHPESMERAGLSPLLVGDLTSLRAIALLRRVAREKYTIEDFPPRTEEFSACEALRNAISALSTPLDEVESWRSCPNAEAIFATSVVARGGSKALLMQILLDRFIVDVKTRLIPALFQALEVVSAKGGAEDGRNIAHADKTKHELEATCSTWAESLVILEDLADRGRFSTIFNAADGPEATTSFGEVLAFSSSALVVPHDFQLAAAALEPCKKVADLFSTSMLACIAEFGWPPTRGGSSGSFDATLMSPPPEFPSFVGNQTCSRCKLSLGRLWLERNSSICIRCDLEWRHGKHIGPGESISCSLVSGGQCPIQTRACLPEAWCLHARRCFSCETHSCEKCSLVSGDGSDVAALAEQSGAVAVFLDFDRTIASTKNGQSPYPVARTSKADGNTFSTGRGPSLHTIDEDLAGLMSWHPNTWIVTRNRHVEDIRDFLHEKGLGGIKGIIHVGKGESKAKLVLDPALWNNGEEPQSGGKGKRPAVLFVDDDVREHLDPLFWSGALAASLDPLHLEASVAALSTPARRMAPPKIHRVLFTRLV